MNKILYLALLTFTGCLTKKSDKFSVCMENNSDTNAVINIETLINGKFYKVIPVRRNTAVVHFESLIVEFPGKGDSLNLTFVISGTKDSTSCVVDRKKWRPESWVHVNFNEVGFKKGARLFDEIFSRDTIVHREFYSE